MRKRYQHLKIRAEFIPHDYRPPEVKINILEQTHRNVKFGRLGLFMLGPVILESTYGPRYINKMEIRVRGIRRELDNESFYVPVEVWPYIKRSIEIYNETYKGYWIERVVYNIWYSLKKLFRTKPQGGFKR